MKFTSKIAAVVAVMGLALACAPVSLQAQTPAAAPAPAKTAKAKPVEYSGNLTAIDAAASTITVSNGSKVLMLVVAPTTKFKVDKKAATLADFAVGDKVTGSYTTDEAGKTTAYSLHKKTLAAAATKTVKKAATSATPAATPAPAAPAGQ